MTRIAALLLLALPLAPLMAQEQTQPAPQLNVSAGWSLGAADQRGTDSPWLTEETAYSGISARWGGTFELTARMTSDFNGPPLTADEVLEKLALTWTTSAGIVTVGKQRLSWGVARIFSAVNSLEPPRDPLHPESQPRGVTGARVELLPSDWLSVSLLALPAARFDDALLAAKADIVWEETDLSVGALRSVVHPVASIDSGKPSRARRESPAFFANFARFFDRFGFYGEAQLRGGRDREWLQFDSGGLVANQGLLGTEIWTLRATGGAQFEFPVWLNGTLRWLTEYHYNGDGFTADEVRVFEDAFGASSQTILASGLSVGAYRRHYLSSGISGVPLTEKITLGGSALAGIDGGLLLLSGRLSWELSSSMTVGLSYDHFGEWAEHQGSELLFLPSRHRVSVSVDAWY